ncbi:MAG: aminotransferase class IV [Myxococcales bacterium]|nr:aminotransferase class IV [Myxococcales bacterium]
MALFRDGEPSLRRMPRGGVFTTLRAQRGRAVDGTAHAARLASHAVELGLSPPPAAHIERVLARVAAATAGDDDLRLRAVIAAAPHDQQVWCEAIAADAALNHQAAPWRLHPVAWPRSPRSHLKQAERREMAGAFAAAAAVGADDALLIGPDGEWLETTRTAIIGVQGRSLIISDSHHILQSVGRRRLIELASAAGLDVQQRRLDAESMAACTECLAVNSFRGVLAVGWCGQTSWPAPGVVTTELKARYAAFVAHFNFATVPEAL